MDVKHYKGRATSNDHYGEFHRQAFTFNENYVLGLNFITGLWSSTMSLTYE